MQDKSVRRDRLNPLFNQYKLTPVGDEPLEASGRMERAGVIFWAYSAPISVKGTEHQAFYLVTTDGTSTDRAPVRTKDIVGQLKGLGTHME